jgi:molybdopterin/thiamine biosynthesis adenylyltransferase
MYYRLRPTADAIPLVEDILLLRTDTLSIRMEGGFAMLLQRLILPALDGRLALSELAQRLEVSAELLRTNFDKLVEAGIFEQSIHPFEQTPPDSRVNLFRAMGIADVDLERRFLDARIAVFGLERPGAMAAEALLAAGFVNLMLVDPTLAQRENFLPDEQEEHISREKLVATRLKRRNPQSSIEISESPSVTRESVLRSAQGFDLLLACWDQGFSSGNHWVNRAAHTLRVPALFSENRGMQGFVGPFVVPGMTACFMCSKMRSIAAAENYDEVMACERFYDVLKSPTHSRREVLGPAMATVASLLASEALRYLVRADAPSSRPPGASKLSRLF